MAVEGEAFSMETVAAYQARARQALKDLGIPLSYATHPNRPLEMEGDDLVSIGLDIFGREQRLERRAAAGWRDLLAAAQGDGITVVVVSAFRSFDYQRKLIERQLAAGVRIEEIVRVSALPGFSEHHTGRAVDVGTPGCPPLTEAFEQTPAFDWLARRAGGFGFSLSYPRNHASGVIYEPWHWRFREAKSRG